MMMDTICDPLAKKDLSYRKVILKEKEFTLHMQQHCMTRILW